MTTDTQKIKDIWRQTYIPVIQRPKQGKLKVKLPEGNLAFDWLSQPGKHSPVWISDYFEVPASWFTDLVARCLSQYRRLYIIQPYNELEMCSPSCKNAQKLICECACMGANHGQGESGGGGWYDINEALQVRWRGETIAARLLTAK